MVEDPCREWDWVKLWLQGPCPRPLVSTRTRLKSVPEKPQESPFCLGACPGAWPSIFLRKDPWSCKTQQNIIKKYFKNIKKRLDWLGWYLHLTFNSLIYYLRLLSLILNFDRLTLMKHVHNKTLIIPLNSKAVLWANLNPGDSSEDGCIKLYIQLKVSPCKLIQFHNLLQGL